MMARLWFVRTRRIVTQYGITDLRDRQPAPQGERIAILALARERGWQGDDGKTQLTGT